MYRCSFILLTRSWMPFRLTAFLPFFLLVLRFLLLFLNKGNSIYNFISRIQTFKLFRAIQYFTFRSNKSLFIYRVQEIFSKLINTLASLVTEGARGGWRLGDRRSVTVGPRLCERPVLGLFLGLDFVLGWISSRCSFVSSRRRGITGSNFSLVGEGSSAPSPVLQRRRRKKRKTILQSFHRVWELIFNITHPRQ